MVKLSQIFCAALLAVASTSVTSAQETQVLNFASPSPPTAGLNVQVFPQWVDAINQAAGGEIEVKLRMGGQMATPRNVYERLQSDVIQIGWMIVPQSPRAFPLLSSLELPFVVPNSEVGSAALWNMVANGGLDRDTEGLKILGVVAFPNQSIHVTNEIGSLNDIAGLKIAASGRTSTSLISELGAAPISILLPERYQAISKGTVDGTIVPFTGVPSFKLDEVTKYHINGDFGSAAAIVFMKQDTFDALSPVAQAALEKASGYEFSKNFGAFWDRYSAGIVERIGQREDQTMISLTEDEITKMGKVERKLFAEWSSNTQGGAAFLEQYRAEVAKIQDQQ